jgi:hypothetical protein
MLQQGKTYYPSPCAELPTPLRHRALDQTTHSDHIKLKSLDFKFFTFHYFQAILEHLYNNLLNKINGDLLAMTEI